MADRVGGAVEAGVLAVPPAGDAVDLRPRPARHELGADHAGRGELLVEPGLEADVPLLAQSAEAKHLLVDATERGALVARDEGAGVQAGVRVGAPLVEREPHDRLEPRAEDPPVLELVLVRETDLSKALRIDAHASMVNKLDHERAHRTFWRDTAHCRQRTAAA